MSETSRREADVDACVDRFVRDHKCVGLAVGIVRNHSNLTSHVRGSPSKSYPRPIEDRSVFRAGSITKLFTGIAVMQLVQEGALELDDPAGDHLRQFEIRSPAGAAPVTLRHLLTHTSGVGELRRPTDLFRPVVGMGLKPGQAMPTLGEYYAPALVARTPPADRWAYANHGFATLGAIIEDVTGESFASRLRRTILDPLGMHHTDFVRSDRVVPDLCDGHGRRFGRPRTVRDLEVIPAPAGSLFTCVADMADFIAMLCAHGSPVLSLDLFEEMVAPQFRLHAGLPAMGLAFMIDDAHGHREVMHDGGWPGFVSHLRVAPDEGLGVVIFTNSASQSIAMAIASFGEQLLQITRGPNVPVRPEPAAVAEPDPRSARRDVHLDLDLHLDRTGTYGLRPGFNTNVRAWMYLGGEVEVSVRGDGLAIRSFAGPIHTPHTLGPVGSHDPRLFDLTLKSSTVRVAFDTDAIHLGLPLNATLHRRSGSFRRRARWLAGLGAALTSAAIAVRHRRRP
jgi:CubicO group peptidase (beta-lactamase class C family)